MNICEIIGIGCLLAVGAGILAGFIIMMAGIMEENKRDWNE
jgi:hypothetical protein